MFIDLKELVSKISISDYSPWSCLLKYSILALTKVRVTVIQIFGNVLRELREASHISQEKLAEDCDLDRTYISLLERGLRQPTITTIFELSRALNIKPSKLIEMVELKLEIGK